MKKAWIIMRWNAVIAGIAAPASAAAKSVDDSSHIVIWAFLSFCALIIVSQLMPVISDFIEARKRAKKEAEELTPATGKSQDGQAGQWRDEQ